jgi:hypothetical protein
MFIRFHSEGHGFGTCTVIQVPKMQDYPEPVFKRSFLSFTKLLPQNDAHKFSMHQLLDSGYLREYFFRLATPTTEKL